MHLLVLAIFGKYSYILCGNLGKLVPGKNGPRKNGPRDQFSGDHFGPFFQGPFFCGSFFLGTILRRPFFRGPFFRVPCADIVRLLQYFHNISDRFWNILAILPYFQEIFLQYFYNIFTIFSEYFGAVWVVWKRHVRREVKFILCRWENEYWIADIEFNSGTSSWESFG